MKANCRGHLSSLLAALLLLVVTQPCFASPNPTRHDTTPHGGAVVSLGDEELFVLDASSGRRDAEARARDATRTLEDSLRADDRRVSTAWVSGVAIIKVGDRVVVELSEEDRKLSSHAALGPYADEIAGRIRHSLNEEHRRRKIAKHVLGVSTVAFLGLLAWFAMGVAGRVARRAERRLERNLASIGAVRIHGVELLPATATREGARLSVVGALWLVRIGLAYSWTLLALSLFGPTRAYASLATGYLFTPALELLGRLAERIPMVIALALALFVVFLIVRFVMLYCGAVERSEIENRWLRPETARTTGTLLAVCVCLAALLFVTPLLAGTSDGALTRIGLLGVGTIALAGIPVIGSCLLGIRIIYGRAWSFEDLIEYGGEKGHVVRMDLFDATLKREDGAIVRVPHLMSLWQPTRIYPTPKPRGSTPPADPAP